MAAKAILFTVLKRKTDILSLNLGEFCYGSCDVLVGGDHITHLSVIVLLISHQVKVAGSGQAKDDSLLLTRLLTL